MALRIQHVKPLRRIRYIFYGWWLVGLFVLIHGMASGPGMAGVGVWIKALELDFGWSRTQLTGAFSVAQMQGIIMWPLMGFLSDRLGPRRMLLIGLLVLGIGFVLFSLTTTLLVLYISFIIIWMVEARGTWLPMMKAVNSWFIRRRSTAMAIAGESYFVGGTLLVPVLAWAVNPNHFGWRNTALWIGVVFLVAAIPMSRLIRNRPEDYGQLPDGDPSPASADGGRQGKTGTETPRALDLTVRQAMGTSAFWFITVGDSISGILHTTLTVHLVPMLTDQGFSLQMAAYVWSAVLLVGAGFSLVGGYVGDRVPKNLALSGFITIQAAGFAMAALIRNAPTAFLVAVMYGIGFGGRTPLRSAIRGDYFGQRAYATITGISMAPGGLFRLVAPLFAAAMYDLRGSYLFPFIVLGALGFGGAVLFSFARKPVSLPSTPPRGATRERR